MRFNRAVGDLRFIIGSFLGLIGLIVLIQAALRPDELTQGIHVNLLGGAMLTGVGLLLALSAFFGNENS